MSRSYSTPKVIATNEKLKDYAEVGSIGLTDLGSSLKDMIENKESDDIQKYASIDQIIKIGGEVANLEARIDENKELERHSGPYSTTIKKVVTPEGTDPPIYPRKVDAADNSVVVDAVDTFAIGGTYTAYILSDGDYIPESVIVESVTEITSGDLEGRYIVKFEAHDTPFENSTFFFNGEYYLECVLYLSVNSNNRAYIDMNNHVGMVTECVGSLLMAPGHEGVWALAVPSAIDTNMSGNAQAYIDIRKLFGSELVKKGIYAPRGFVQINAQRDPPIWAYGNFQFLEDNAVYIQNGNNNAAKIQFSGTTILHDVALINDAFPQYISLDDEEYDDLHITIRGDI